MSEATKDPAIKLFGRTIPLPDARPPSPGALVAEPLEEVLEEAGEEQETAAADVSGSDAGVSEMDVAEGVKDVSEMRAGMEVENLNIVADSCKGKENTQISSSSVSSVNEDDHKACSEDDNAASNSKAEFSKTETDGPVQEKLKKPDKILPCPRCNSMDTKFCYYNNYNINQPRHFCKNCQRYWTAGGTMRNVPVGAGRRKSKHSSSQYRHIMMASEGLQSPRLENPDVAHNQTVSCGPSTSSRPLTSNGTVLKFGQEVPLCESMASVLNIRDQKLNGDFNSVVARENKEEPSCASSVTVSNGATNVVEHIQQNGTQSYSNGVTPLPHFQCYGGAPWPYPWHPGWNNIAAMAATRCPSELVCRPENSNPNPVPWMAPAFCPPALPYPFMPASFWGCMSSWPNAAWNIPWVGPNGGISPSSSTSNSGCSGNCSPTLGKHSRDTNLQGEEKTEKSLWVPKTLRIDDPDEAAKSSIWSTLGIKPDEGGIFKSFQSKGGKNGQTSDAAQVLHANPAALSRSRSFQEST